MKILKKWGPLGALIALIVTAYSMGWHQALNLESLQTQKDIFQNYASENPQLSALIFFSAYVSAVALSLPISTFLTLLGGFLFGKWFGTALVITAATLGASIFFLIAKTALSKTLHEKAGDFYKKIEKNMNENATGYLLFMRLVPLFPFALVNIVPALFNVRLHIFILTTFFGIIPASFVYVNVGQTLGDLTSINDLISIQTLAAFGLLGLLALIPTVYKQIKNHRT